MICQLRPDIIVTICLSNVICQDLLKSAGLKEKSISAVSNLQGPSKPSPLLLSVHLKPPPSRNLLHHQLPATAYSLNSWLHRLSGSFMTYHIPTSFLSIPSKQYTPSRLVCLLSFSVSPSAPGIWMHTLFVEPNLFQSPPHHFKTGHHTDPEQILVLSRFGGLGFFFLPSFKPCGRAVV